MDFPLYFQKVLLLWQGSIVDIDYGFLRVFGPYFIGKSLGGFINFDIWTLVIYRSPLVQEHCTAVNSKGYLYNCDLYRNSVKL